MRTDGELLEREELSGLIDPSKKVLFALERWALGADETEHNDFAFRHKAQRFEGAGTLVVVFEEEAIDGQFVEETFGDDVVASFRVPVTAIAAAKQALSLLREAVSICAGSTRSSFSIHAIHLGSR